MHESFLNSLFLGSDPRREGFRQARRRLQQARGEHTAQVDELALPAHPRSSVTTACRFLLLSGQTIYPLKIGTNTIGRFSNNDVVLNDPHVSRRHCVLLVHTNGGCELHDTASLNGTLIRGERVTEPRALYSGNCIQIGPRKLTFLSAHEFSVVRRTALAGDTLLD